VPAEFEHRVSAGERPQTYTLDREAIESAYKSLEVVNINALLDLKTHTQTRGARADFQSDFVD
jgi:hypothetical protein